MQLFKYLIEITSFFKLNSAWRVQSFEYLPEIYSLCENNKIKYKIIIKIFEWCIYRNECHEKKNKNLTKS